MGQIKTNNTKFSRADIYTLIIIPIVAACLTLGFHLNYLTATLLFFGVPAIYLSFRKPATIKKALLFSTLVIAPFVLLLDYPASVNGLWLVPHSLFTLFSGHIPIEDIAWAYTWMYFTTIAWEYFFEPRYKDNVVRKIFYFCLLMALAVVGFFYIYFSNPDWFIQSYFYLKFGLIFVAIPIAISLYKSPALFRRLLPFGIYFLLLATLVELTAFKESHWIFQSGFIGHVLVSGKVLPYEEILFWWLLGAPGLVAWYELFFIHTQD
jgi:hypothetical protein